MYLQPMFETAEPIHEKSDSQRNRFKLNPPQVGDSLLYILPQIVTPHCVGSYIITDMRHSRTSSKGSSTLSTSSRSMDTGFSIRCGSRVDELVLCFQPLRPTSICFHKVVSPRRGSNTCLRLMTRTCECSRLFTFSFRTD